MGTQEILFQAIREYDLDLITKILKEDISLLNSKDNRGYNPLLLASYYGYEDIVDFILELDPMIDDKDTSGNTALMGVCFKGFEKYRSQIN